MLSESKAVDGNADSAEVADFDSSCIVGVVTLSDAALSPAGCTSAGDIVMFAMF